MILLYISTHRKEKQLHNTKQNKLSTKFKSMFTAILMSLTIIGIGGMVTAPAASAATTNCNVSKPWFYQTFVGGYKHANRKIVQRNEREVCAVTHNAFEKTFLGKKDYRYTRDTGWYDYTVYDIKTGKKVAYSKSNMNALIRWYPSTSKYKGDKYWNNLPG